MTGTIQGQLKTSGAAEIVSSDDPFGIDQLLQVRVSSNPIPTPPHLKAISLVLKFELAELRLRRDHHLVYPMTSGYLLTSSPQGVA